MPPSRLQLPSLIFLLTGTLLLLRLTGSYGHPPFESDIDDCGGSGGSSRWQLSMLACPPGRHLRMRRVNGRSLRCARYTMRRMRAVCDYRQVCRLGLRFCGRVMPHFDCRRDAAWQPWSTWSTCSLLKEKSRSRSRRQSDATDEENSATNSTDYESGDEYGEGENENDGYSYSSSSSSSSYSFSSSSSSHESNSNGKSNSKSESQTYASSRRCVNGECESKSSSVNCVNGECVTSEDGGGYGDGECHGEQIRTRVCQRELFSPFGLACVGSESETRPCASTTGSCGVCGRPDALPAAECECANAGLWQTLLTLNASQWQVALNTGKAKPDLGIVIDVTGSMALDLARMKTVIDDVVAHTTLAFSRHVLTALTDPYEARLLTSSDPAVIGEFLRSLVASGGGDCPEPSLTALAAVSEAVSNGSVLLVITDAAASDAGNDEDGTTVENLERLLKLRDQRLLLVECGAEMCGQESEPGDSGASLRRLAVASGGGRLKAGRGESDVAVALLGMLAQLGVGFVREAAKTQFEAAWHIIQGCYRPQSPGAYMGPIDVSASGRRCQSWTPKAFEESSVTMDAERASSHSTTTFTQSPTPDRRQCRASLKHPLQSSPADSKSEKSSAKAACRSPNAGDASQWMRPPWCIVEKDGKMRQEECRVPQCSCRCRLACG